MFCSMFLNLLFIFLNFAFIVFSTINVENSTSTWRSNDNCKFESIIFAVLSRSKVWISFFIWAFRLNRDKFVRAFCVFATSSRRLSSDDITSMFTSCYALIRIRKRDYTNVYKAFKVWLFLCWFWSRLIMINFFKIIFKLLIFLKKNLYFVVLNLHF
jgi:hypothetical protein